MINILLATLLCTNALISGDSNFWIAAAGYAIAYEIYSGLHHGN
jgi:hypothetical protein